MQDDAFVVVPGQTFQVTLRFDASSGAKGKNVSFPGGWGDKRRILADGTSSHDVTVAKDAPLTRPYWHRDNPETDTINTIDRPEYFGLPFPPNPVWVRAEYEIDGQTNTIDAPVIAKYKGADGTELDRPVSIAPAFSVTLEPGTQTIRVEGDPGCDVRVGVRYELSAPIKGKLRLEIPAGWRVEPSELPAEFTSRGQKKEFEFKVYPASLKEGRAHLRAVLEAGGAKYSEGYSLVTREDLDSFYYYQPAVQRVSIVDVKVPKDLKVGYVMGAGDDIPTVLEQIGMNVTNISPEKLASEDLSKYSTIVLGVRAYDTQKDVAANNKKLLDYVSNGGTLIVQYNAGPEILTVGKFTPYPASLGRAEFRWKRHRWMCWSRTTRYSTLPTKSRRRTSRGGCRSAG